MWVGELLCEQVCKGMCSVVFFVSLEGWSHCKVLGVKE